MNLSKLPRLSFLNRLAGLWRYRIVGFIVLFTALAGYLVLQINSAVNVAPSEDSPVAAGRRTPRIDPDLVKQLQSLQDNSVSVQALFNEARDNPFR